MKNAEKFFIYARKSTDREDQQVQSIESQLMVLREYAERENFAVVGEFIEKQSAKNPGRPEFGKMLAKIQAGAASAIIAWHPDRLARNSVDGGYIIHLLDTRVIKTLRFPTSWFENTPQGKLTLSMAFGFSKYYVDALGENVKRGMDTKVARGEFPHKAPFGYLNNPRTKLIYPDPDRSPLVQEAFARYATGTETLDTLRDWFASRGIRASGGGLVGRVFVSELLTNPIHYGDFKHGGEIHRGIHQPIISKQLFDAVQTILKRRYTWSSKDRPVTPKPFMGLLRCKECGSAITAEVQKGHTYYRCTKKNRAVRCAQPFVREEALDSSLSALLSPFAIRAEFADALLARVEGEKSQSKQSMSAVLAQKKAEIDRINDRLHRLQDGYLDGIFERDLFLSEKAKLTSERRTLQEQSETLVRNNNHWLEPMKNWISEAKALGETVRTGARFEKRALAKKIFGSNLVLDCKNASGRAIYPWAILADNLFSNKMVPKGGLEPPCG